MAKKFEKKWEAGAPQLKIRIWSMNLFGYLVVFDNNMEYS